MQDADAKLHVVELNDEVIDLRNKVFDKEYIPVPPVRSRTDVPPFYTKQYESEPVLQKAKIKKRIPVGKDLQRPKVSDLGLRLQESVQKQLRSQPNQNNGLKKLADTLYNGPVSFSSVSSSTATAVSKPLQVPNIVRNRPILRTKIPNSRLTSIDPRFRRARSPSSKKQSLVTQSESRVSPASSERRKSKSQSDSKFLLNSQTSDPISTQRVQIGENQGDSAPSTKKLALHKYADAKSNKGEFPANRSSDKVRGTDEDPTITESTTIVGVSLYQSAVCGEGIVPPKETEVYATVKLLKLYDRSRNYKPFWDDPRLIDKYGKFLKPVSIAPRNSLSSWTLPIGKASRYCDDSIDGDCQRCLLKRNNSQKPLFKETCSKCICTFDNETIYTDQSIRTMLPCEPRKKKLCSLMFTNYLLAIFFGIGSICGLLLVALVVWVIANDMMWMCLQKSTEPKLTGMTSWVAYMWGGVIYGVVYMCRTVGYLFVVPRNEVYDSGTKVDVVEPWYTCLTSWL